VWIWFWESHRSSNTHTVRPAFSADKMKLILSVNIYIKVPERYFIFVIFFKARIDIIKVQGAKHTAQRSHPSFLMPSPSSRQVEGWKRERERVGVFVAQKGFLLFITGVETCMRLFYQRITCQLGQLIPKRILLPFSIYLASYILLSSVRQIQKCISLLNSARNVDIHH